MSKLSSGTAGILALGLIAAPMACIVTGCANTQAVAATVNGEAIDEQTITDYIQNYRETNDLMDDQSWAQYLVDNDMTPETLREQTINYYVQQKVIEQDAASKDLSVSDDEVEAQLTEIKDYYDYDDAKLEEQVESIGYTMDTYKEYVKQSLLQEKLTEAVTGDDVPSDEEILESAKSYASILNGAKYIDTIVFDAADAEKAADVAKQAKEGGDFEQLSAENSTTENFDGWDVLVIPDDAVATAVANMKAGDVSDVIESADGTSLFVVKVTEVCNVDEEKGFASVEEIPTEIKEQIAESLKTSNASMTFSTYIDEKVEEAEVVINPMPEGLPYDVSLDGVESSSGTVDTGSISVDEDGSATTVTVDEDGNVVPSDEPIDEEVAVGEESVETTEE